MLPYGQTDAKPMPPNTKRKVKIARLVQLAVRILEMICVLGILVCAICISHTQNTVGWVLRAAVSSQVSVDAKFSMLNPYSLP